MAEFADQPFHIRSNSMPSTSHPTSLKVEEELHKIRAHLPSSSRTAQMMCNELRGIGDLYELIDELLRLPSSQFCQKKWVEEQLDCSLRLLDMIAAIRDSLMPMREHVQYLHSAIRRKGNAVTESRKKAQKMIKDCLKSLKQIDRSSVPCSIDNNSDQLVMILMEAREIGISLLRSILTFLSKPKTKASRWSIIYKSISKRQVACEGQCEGATEEESADLWLQASCDCILSKDVNAIKVQKAHDDLETLEVKMESLESGLELLFRQLIKNRVTLLNILSL